MQNKKFLTVFISCLSLTSAIGQPKLNPQNIDEIIRAMTLEEKATLLVGSSDQQASSGTMVGATQNMVAGAAGTTAAIPRLGVPSTVLADGPAGVRIDPTRKGTSKTYYATGFPVGTALACSWNTSLIEQVGKALGKETLEYGCDVILGPGVNIMRNPLCGRNFEYFSEDPLLTGKMAAAYIHGVQSQGVGTSIKHFAANSQETNRGEVNSVLSQRALREIYLRGFEIAIKESSPWTVMSSYNKVNGTFTQESRELLTDILRDEWGYNGIVMTDWTGMRNTAAQVRAGNDLMEPGLTTQVDDILDKVKSGELKESHIDTCVRRILEYVVRTPHYRGYNYSDNPDLKAHAGITRQSATEGMVLLKNEGVLPLKDIKTVALFGVNSYDFLSGGTGSGFVHTPYVVDMVKGLAGAGIGTTQTLTEMYQSYLDFARKKFAADMNPFMWFLNFGQVKIPEFEVSRRCINAEVQHADAAIVTIGRQAGEAMDREIDGDFNLTQMEREMLQHVGEAFHQAGKPLIVVINSGSVIETSSWRDMADAILVAWQPGEEGGNSVADVLTGKANPSGKLTMTWPVQVTDGPSTKNFPHDMQLYDFSVMKAAKWPVPNYDTTKYEEDIYVGYRYFDTFGKKVSYPFGYGLSYTTFDYGKPTVKANGDSLTITVSVRNTGAVTGKEIVQVYVSAPDSRLQKPSQELRAFAKTRELKPGESETLKITMAKRDLASFDEANSQWLVDSGIYTFRIGASSRDIRGTATLRINGTTEPVHNVMPPDQPFKTLQQS